jgi:hypothetical protein
MTSSHGPIYETTFYVDAERAAEFDAWLVEHAQDALVIPEVADCRVFAIDDDAEGRQGRICQYTLADDEVAEHFLEGYGTDVEAEAESLFQVLFSSRLLREDSTIDVAPGENPDCLNCGTRLRGQYCGSCGQRARSRLISLWELVSDAFGDLFELDSRLWKTLGPLLFRPGKLTYEYLAGKRARFMPPFRTYLVLSLLFFLVAFFDPLGNLDLEPVDEAAEEQQKAEAEEAVRETMEELAEQGIIIGDDLPDEVASEIAESDNGINFEYSVDSDDDCQIDGDDLDDIPGILKHVITPQRAEHFCKRMNDEPRQLLENLIDNVPAALIVLLPLMALVLKMLYPLSRHYYVEHLLFFIHFHAFFFLLLTIQILLGRLGNLVFIPEPIVVLAIVIASFYVPIYLFVAMRRVYAQGFVTTLLKYMLLLVAYSLGFAVTMLGAFVVAALSI